jgi:hypothetical protein
MSVEQLQRLRNTDAPWLMVSSFVNPHDITLWGDLTVASSLAGTAGSFYLPQQLAGSNVPRNLFGPMYEASSREDLSTKPSAQGSFVDLYPRGFQPMNNGEMYHRFYYQLQKEVDQHVTTVLEALQSDRRMYRETIVVYLSDHGELLGAHGGMFQKWHNAYDEMLRVPLIFHNPELFQAQSSDVLTSHADLIPTMLGLAGLDEKSIGRELRKTHTQVRRLVGRDLSGILLGEDDGSSLRSEPVFFMTDDQVFRGAKAVSSLGMSYQPVVQPASVETVVAFLPTGPDGADERWKYSRFWDNPALWSSPGVQDVQTFVPGMVNTPGQRVAITTVKAPNPTAGQVAPPPDEFEMYNVTLDPGELDNLAGNSSFANTQRLLSTILNEQRTQKRLAPLIEPWADGTKKQFPFTPN